jgi:hypothetical protein
MKKKKKMTRKGTIVINEAEFTSIRLHNKKLTPILC